MQAGKRERRQLGLPAATAVVTGEAIALGIFLTPAAMAKSLGSPLLLGLVWLGVAFMAMCGALSYSELRADKSGVITARNIEVGQVAQAAQPAFTLAVDGPRDAVFNVYESIFFQKPASDKIILTLVSDPNIRATGHVREVAPAVDPKTGTVRVKVEMDNAPAAMSLGSSVVGSDAFASRQVAVLPWSAAASLDGKLAIWIVDPATKAVSLRAVQPEAFEKEKLLIRDGLAPGEIVVTEGEKFLFPGQIVDIAEAAP